MEYKDIELLLDVSNEINKYKVNLPSLKKSIEKFIEEDYDFEKVYLEVEKYISKDNKGIADLSEVIEKLSKITDIDIISRIKSKKSLSDKWNKYKGRKWEVRKVFNDIVGIRIVTHNEIDDIIYIIEKVKKIKNYNIYIKDYRSKPKSNDDGYRGVHSYIQNNSKSFKVEIQTWDKINFIFSVYTHGNIYKSDKNNVDYSMALREWIEQLSVISSCQFTNFLYDIMSNPKEHFESLAKIIVSESNSKHESEYELYLLDYFIYLNELKEDSELIIKIKEHISNIHFYKEEYMSFGQYICILILKVGEDDE